MALCPNCGEIVMNGDPYCSHCGTTFRWVEEEEETSRQSRRRGELILEDIPIELFYRVVDMLDESEYVIYDVKRRFDVTKVSEGTFDIYQRLPRMGLQFTFTRKNRYFTSVDHVTYSCLLNQMGGHRYHDNFEILKNTQWFKDSVIQKQEETGLEFYDCAGGYQASWALDGSNVFELRPGCRVIAHFTVDEKFTRGYEVDFARHKLKDDFEIYECDLSDIYLLDL